MALTFQKEERLCNKKIIEKLFSKGNRAFTLFPFRFSWVCIPLDKSVPVQVLLTVSKRNFPNAIQRNSIKRQIRELYRLHKSDLYQAIAPTSFQYALMISYIAKEKTDFKELENKFFQSFKRLISEIEKTDSNTIYSTDKVL